MRPSILGFFTVGMTTLSMLSVSCVLYSALRDRRHYYYQIENTVFNTFVAYWLVKIEEPDNYRNLRTDRHRTGELRSHFLGQYCAVFENYFSAYFNYLKLAFTKLMSYC